MRRNLIRQTSVGTALAVIAAAAAGAAFAAPKAGHDRFTVRGGLPGVNGVRNGGFGAFGGPGVFGRFPGGGPGFGGPGFGLGGPDFGGPGRGFDAPGGGILAADILTPAAAFLNIPATDLAADLKGGKTLAQEATAKGKKPADLIDAIVAAEKKILDEIGRAHV